MKKLNCKMRHFLVICCVFLSFGAYAQKQIGVNTVLPLKVLHVDGKGDNKVGGANVEEYKNDVVVDEEGRVGVGTVDPVHKLDVRGKLYSEGLTLKTESIINTSDLSGDIPLLINQNTGVVSLSPSGYSKVVGGTRPHGGSTGDKAVIKIPNRNTLMRVRFVAYTHKSNAANNNDEESYNYGDFVIVGFNDSSSLKIVDAQVKGSDGNVRTDAVITNKSITWRSGTQGNLSIKIDSVKGELIMSVGTQVTSYLFEVFGGI